MEYNTILTKLCRTCLLITVDNVRHLYQNNIANILTDCLSTQLDLNDKMPQVICSTCWNLVDSFNQFKQKSRENERFLKSCLDSNTIIDETYFLALIDAYRADQTVATSIKQEKPVEYEQTAEHTEPTPAPKSDVDDDIDVKSEFNPFYTEKPAKKTKKRKRAIKHEETSYTGVFSDGFSDGDFSMDSWESYASDKKPLSCTKCSQVFTTENFLHRHMLRHSSEKLKCPENCKRTFTELQRLIRHVRIKHKYTKNKKCVECDAKFYVQSQLDRHYANKHGVKKKERETLCPICGDHYELLKKHMLSHRKQCDYCGKTFEKREYMRMHVKRIHECKVCHICGKRYTSSNHLSKHEVSNDGQEYGYVKDVPCPQCGKHFASKRNLLSHVSAVHHAKMAICPVCNLSIKKKNLNRHILAIHEQCVKAVCSICSAKFKDGYSLKMHMRMHTDERPYPCSYCDKTFRHGGTLKKHIRIHTGERPYACKICNKTFNQSTPLKTHMKTHTGERPYACKVCAKTFSQSCSLATHMKTHFKQEPITDKATLPPGCFS